MNITNHARRRIHQRMARRPPAGELGRLVEQVLQYGISLEDARGRVRDYIRARTVARSVRVVLFNGYTFIFNHGALVTVYRIRGVVRRLAGRQQRRKREDLQRRQGRPRRGQAYGDAGGCCDLRPDC